MRNNNNNSQNINQSGGNAGISGNNSGVSSRQITEKDVGIELRVTPRINDESRITLLVDASVEALLSAAKYSLINRVQQKGL